MVNLAPGADAVLAERDVVREERRQRVENSPESLFFEQEQALLWLNHPYRLPVIGWPQEIEAFSRELALAFYRAHYAPDNAILVVAGDVEPVEVERLAEKHFGLLPAAGASPRERPQEPSPVAARRIVMHDARVREPTLSRLYLAPQRKPGDQAEAAALEVLAELLGGSDVTSVLSREMELGDGIALDAGAHYNDVGVDPRSFGLYVSPKPKVGLEQAEAQLDMVLADFLERGPDPEQMARIKTQMRAEKIYDRDSQMGRAREIGAALASGLSLQDVADWPDLLQEVTADDVLAAARAVFQPESSVTGWLTGGAPQ